jgi:hypothetical protein
LLLLVEDEDATGVEAEVVPGARFSASPSTSCCFCLREGVLGNPEMEVEAEVEVEGGSSPEDPDPELELGKGRTLRS